MSQEPINPSSDVPGAAPAAATPPNAAQGPIVARAGRYFRNTRYVMFLLVLGFGIWCIHDGWVAWPRENRQLTRALEDLQAAQQANDEAAIARLSTQRDSMKMHTATDLMIQKVLGGVLPPLAVLLLIRALYLSRGEYRLEADQLHAPGHPPIPLECITEVDRKLWDRKGILYVKYQTPGGPGGRVKLDDFVYARGPIDAIVERINAETARIRST